MRFQQYLNEGIITPNGIKLARDSANLERDLEKKLYNDAIDFFIENEDKIKPILSILKNHKTHKSFLYRGIQANDTKGDSFGIIKTRKDRRPLTTDTNIHNLFNNYLYDKLKWKPRTEGTFATFYRNGASFYSSNVYIVFPIGLLKYMYSPDVSDSYNVTKTSDIAKNIYSTNQDKYKSYIDVKETIENDKLDSNLVSDIEKYWDGAYPVKTTGLHNQMVKNTEIVFKCDEYMFFDEEMFYLLKLLIYEGL